MEISAKYNPAETEQKWYDYWLKNNFFASTPDSRTPFTIVIPPPNVTGVLHMGHMLNNTIQDVLIRRARMQGLNACWVPGTDHASIATEAKVVAKLKAEGIDKNTLTREEFLKHAWEWKEKHGGIILEQLKKLGASCDWHRTSFTMDESLSESVIEVFVDLFNKNKIYRGARMVNWDPQAKTAVSDEEVIYKELQSKLYYIRYKIENTENEWVTIATTRPETILGDTAVCVNPNDERFKQLAGKRVLVPLINRSIPIIQDEYVEMEFGTGCLKVTPAHDINDYEIGIRHNLESVDIFNDDGTLSQAAQLYIGEDRFEVRKSITQKLQEEGHIVKIEDYVNKVGFSERTNSVIEPKISMQWFLKMKELAQPALDNVVNETIKLYPPKFVNTYKHWMENVRDWCISRQLWWGHRIPAYYLPNSNEFVVAASAEKALKIAIEKTGNYNLKITDLRQDEDVLDTWFSSWLWPISVFDGIRYPENEDIKYYYPSNVLVTGHDIIFFWVARMIMSGYEYRNEYPFKDVYFTGMVRDNQGRKMSKQLGNSPDPLDLMKEYGADGVRVGMLFCSPAGGDLLFDNSLPEQGRNFGNKIWNAFRLIKSWTVDSNIEQPIASCTAIEWLNAKISNTVEIINTQFHEYRLSEALMSVYKLFWDDFSAWYLEAIKPAYLMPIDLKTYQSTLTIFDKLLRLLHPCMPFITEELWQALENRAEGETIMYAAMPENEISNPILLNAFEQAQEVIAKVRAIRSEKNIAIKENVVLKVKASDFEFESGVQEVVKKLAYLSEFSLTEEKLSEAASFYVGTTEYYVPLGNLINKEEEIKKLTAELKYTEGFLISVEKKLSNERFVTSAPEAVVAKEKEKQADAISKIESLKAQISALQ